MRQIPTALRLLTVATLAMFSLSCATTSTTSTENMALQAGFKPITPTTAEQKAILAKLPEGKMHELKYHGKTIYVLPDHPNNRAMVGTPKAFQAYKQLRQANNMSNEHKDLMARPTDEMQKLNWLEFDAFPDWAAESRIP